MTGFIVESLEVFVAVKMLGIMTAATGIAVILAGSVIPDYKMMAFGLAASIVGSVVFMSVAGWSA